MSNEKSVIKSKKYTIIFGITLIIAMMFIACDNSPEIHMPIENNYGRIYISISSDEMDLQQARTVFPSLVFDKYVYIFTKESEATGVEVNPDNEGFFILEVDVYTVEVQAYIGDNEPYTLVASGISSEFTVGSSNNDPVVVNLGSVNSTSSGEFRYTVTFPEGAIAEITLHKWQDMSNITLTSNNIAEGNGVTEILTLEAGYYYLTILVSKDEFYAGLNEIIHIYPLLTTPYNKDFSSSDLLAFMPVANVNITVNALEKGEVPVTTASGTGNFTISEVMWSPEDEPFLGGEIYTASIILTAGYRHTFTGTNSAITNGQNAIVSNNTGATVTLSYTFPVLEKFDGGIAGTPTLVSKTHNSIIINPAIVSTGQTAEYGINTINTEPSTWQTELIFDELEAGTTYYIFARSVENNNYESGAISDSLTVITLQTTSPDRFEYYWVNAHGSLVTTSGGITTVAPGGILTITAQAAGYTVNQWHLNGVNTGQSGNTYNFSSTTTGRYTVGLFVEKDGKLYNTNITIEVLYTVTFNANNATDGTPPSQINTYSNITIPGHGTLTRIGYTFAGWNTNSSGTGTNYNAGVVFSPTENITLYTRWTSTVTYNLNDGSGTTPEAQTVNADSNITLPVQGTITRARYTFAGWNTESSGTGTNHNAGSSYTPTGHITLYARWTSTVTYNINGGTGATPSAQIVNAGSSITLNNGGGFSRNGYIFSGWSTNSSGTGTNFDASSSYTPTGNITLYARWVWEGQLTHNVRANGNITSTGAREQWFRFTANTSTQYIFFYAGTLNNVYIELYNSSGDLIGSNGTVIISNNMYIWWPDLTTSGQEYYLRVRPVYSNESGTYQIAFSSSTTRP